VAARRALLDALDALDRHADAVVVAGSQAIYALDPSPVDGVRPCAADSDLVLDPDRLPAFPPLCEAMRDAGFVPRRGHAGAWWPVRHRLARFWWSADATKVDLVDPGDETGRPSRAFALHGANVVRPCPILRLALGDRARALFEAAEAGDSRRREATVAGPGALLLTKVHELRARSRQTSERGSPDERMPRKDALDVLRVLRQPAPRVLAGVASLVSRADLRPTALSCLEGLEDLFGHPGALGARLVGEALDPLRSREDAAQEASDRARDLLDALEARGRRAVWTPRT
jgi:hypothetical protein